jgi:hypothetical protein
MLSLHGCRVGKGRVKRVVDYLKLHLLIYLPAFESLFL